MALLGHYNDQAQADTYDKVIIGGGPVGLFTAYEILRQAADAGKKIKLAVIAEEINAPSAAGSQIFHGTDGSYVNGQTAEVDALLRAGQTALYDTIDREKINCREKKGLEIKAPALGDLRSFTDSVVDLNIFRPHEMRINSQAEQMKFNGYPHSVIFEQVGQINVPELQAALIQKIKDMGGTVIDGARYQGQTADPATDNTRILKTSKGEIKTTSKPLLATGAQHLLSLPELKGAGETIWTMSVVHGPLSPQDQQKIASTPTAFALIGGQSEIEADFPWGGLDEKGYLTFGMGDTPNPEKKQDVEKGILASIDHFFPGMSEKYKDTKVISFGAMLASANAQPIVGRFKDYDVLGGWGGRGITPGYAAALAYADLIVRRNDHKLTLFEKMQPHLPFASNAPEASIDHTANL